MGESVLKKPFTWVDWMKDERDLLRSPLPIRVSEGVDSDLTKMVYYVHNGETRRLNGNDYNTKQKHL